MFQIIAYGSLLCDTELSKHLLDPSTATPVTVHGFRRSFNQEPSWRASGTRRRAVLSVSRHAGSNFNAVLVAGLDDWQLKSLDKRERGYTRVTVPASELSLFGGGDFPRQAGNTFLYCGKRHKRNDTLLPNPAYLNLCLDAAMRRGSDFHRSFLSSTFVSGHSLEVYLANA